MKYYGALECVKLDTLQKPAEIIENKGEGIGRKISSDNTEKHMVPD